MWDDQSEDPPCDPRDGLQPRVQLIRVMPLLSARQHHRRGSGVVIREINNSDEAADEIFAEEQQRSRVIIQEMDIEDALVSGSASNEQKSGKIVREADNQSEIAK